MTVTLIIARHGNTFQPGEPPRRVGLRTDLPLTASGIEQAHKLAGFLKAEKLTPEIFYSSQLKRTIETATIVRDTFNIKKPIHQSDLFNELDYGPDENLPEPAVITRIGAQTMTAWDMHGIMPQEWSPKPEVIERRWADFAAHCMTRYQDMVVFVATSNGIARFAPTIARNADDVAPIHARKMATGALSIFEGDGDLWFIQRWNIKP